MRSPAGADGDAAGTTTRHGRLTVVVAVAAPAALAVVDRALHWLLVTA